MRKYLRLVSPPPQVHLPTGLASPRSNPLSLCPPHPPPYWLNLAVLVQQKGLVPAEECLRTALLNTQTQAYSSLNCELASMVTDLSIQFLLKVLFSAMQSLEADAADANIYNYFCTLKFVNGRSGSRNDFGLIYVASEVSFVGDFH